MVAIKTRDFGRGPYRCKFQRRGDAAFCLVDSGWPDCRLGGGQDHEGFRLWHPGRHHSWNCRGCNWRLDHAAARFHRARRHHLHHFDSDCGCSHPGVGRAKKSKEVSCRRRAGMGPLWYAITDTSLDCAALHLLIDAAECCTRLGSPCLLY